MKYSAKETEKFFKKRARRANPAKVDRILARVGKGNPPVPGDELPPGYVIGKFKRKAKKK
jgi:hypothetical protein